MEFDPDNVNIDDFRKETMTRKGWKLVSILILLLLGAGSAVFNPSVWFISLGFVADIGLLISVVSLVILARGQLVDLYRVVRAGKAANDHGWSNIKPALLGHIELRLWQRIILVVTAVPFAWALFKISLVTLVAALVIGVIVYGLIFASKRGWIG